MKRLISIILFLGSIFIVNAQLPDDKWPQTNEYVSEMITKGDTIFIAGGFTKVYGIDSTAVFGTALDKYSSSILFNFPRPNGKINEVLSDGKKGFFICGEFTKIGDSLRRNIAHIDSNGNLTSLLSNFGTDNPVHSMVLRKDTLYFAGGFRRVGDLSSNPLVIINENERFKNVPSFSEGGIEHISPDGNGGWVIGGDFKKINNKEQKYIARIDCSGNLINWNVDINGKVRRIVVDNEKVYVVGDFTIVKNKTRTGLAVVDLHTAEVSPLNVVTDGVITDIEIFSNAIYICGNFSKIGNENRKYLGAINKITGDVLPWNPKPDNIVYCLAANKDKLYVGGYFRSFQDTTTILRDFLASFNLSTGKITSFSPVLNKEVLDILIHKNNVYACGYFSKTGNETRQLVVSFDSLNNLRTWNPDVKNSHYSGHCVIKLAAYGNKIFFVGNFDSVSTNNRYGFSAVDDSIGKVLDYKYANFEPTYAISAWDGQLALGTGRGAEKASYIREGIGAVNLTTNAITNLNSISARFTSKICINNNYLYCNTDPGLVEIDISTGKNTGWAPDFDNTGFSSMYAIDSLLFISASYIRYIDNLRMDRSFVIYNLNTKKLIDWPDVKYTQALSMFHLDDTLYLGGGFGLMAVNIKTGKRVNWAPQINGSVSAMTLLKDMLYLSGEFKDSSGSISNLAVINFYTLGKQGWGENVIIPGIRSIAGIGNKIYVGGVFTNIGGYERKKLAAIDTRTGKVLPLKMDVVGGISSLALSDNYLYIAGLFDSIANEKRNNLACMDLLKGNLTSWNPGVNSSTSLVVKSNELFVGGSFTSISGKSQKGLASFNISTGNITNWNPNMTGNIRGMKESGDTLFIGGTFTNISGQPRERLAAFSISSKSLLPWAPKVTGASVVNKLMVYKDKVYVLGMFSSINGQTRRNIASIDKQDAVLSNWNPDFDTYPVSLAAYKNMICVGGNFGQVNGVVRRLIAVVDTGAANVSEWNLGLPSSLSPTSVSKVFEYNGNLYIGGTFTAKNFFTNFIRLPSPLEWQLTVDSSINNSECAGGNLQVPFKIFPDANENNTFYTELSDENGCFSNPIILGSYNGQEGGALNVSLPSSIPSGSGYRIRVRSTSPELISPDFGPIIITNTVLKAGFDINDTITCSLPSLIKITDTSVSTNSYARKWSFSDGYSDTSGFLSRTFLTKGDYSVMLNVSSSGCSDSVIKIIHISDKPDAKIFIQDKKQCLKTNRYLLIDTSLNQDSLYSRMWLLVAGHNDTAKNIMHSFSQPGVYKIGLLATSNYCTDTAYDSVSVSAPPPVSFTFSDTAFCIGDSSTLTAIYTAGDSLLWYKDSVILVNQKPVVSVYNAGKYQLKIISQDGCDSMSGPLHINVYNYPVKPIIKQNGFMLQSSSDKNNQWLKDNIDIPGATDTIYDVTSNGAYQVKVTEKICSIYSNSVQILNVSVQTINGQNNISVYPNPTTADVLIEGQLAGSFVNVYDGLGKIIYQAELLNTINKIPLAQCPSGLYYMEVVDKKNTKSIFKITKE